VAIFVLATLGAAVDSLMAPVRQVGAERLLNTREAARANVMASRLPMAYEERVEAVDGVKAATGVLSDLAILAPEGTHVFVRAVDAERYRAVHPIEVDEAAWTAFRENPRAAVVGHRLMAQMDWEIGDTVEIDMLGLRVEIAGLIPPQGVDLEDHMLVQRSHLQETRGARGQISYVIVSPDESRSPGEVASLIDAALAYTPNPAKTVSVESYAEAIVEDFMGFLDYLRIMGAVTVLITILGAANAVAMSVRERTREFGMLKAIGYQPGDILTMVLLESITLSVLGGALGIAAGLAVIGAQGGAMSAFVISTPTILIAGGWSVIVGCIGGLLPALAAAKLRPIEALRCID
jgi:putative ABC transport system permease protein